MLSGDFLRLIRTLCIDPSRIGIYASSKVSDEENRATVYFRDKEVCAVEKNEIPIRSIIVDGLLIARGVVETLDILATRKLLVPGWRGMARKIIGGCYGL